MRIRYPITCEEKSEEAKYEPPIWKFLKPGKTIVYNDNWEYTISKQDTIMDVKDDYVDLKSEHTFYYKKRGSNCRTELIIRVDRNRNVLKDHFKSEVGGVVEIEATNKYRLYDLWIDATKLKKDDTIVLYDKGGDGRIVGRLLGEENINGRLASKFVVIADSPDQYLLYYDVKTGLKLQTATMAGIAFEWLETNLDEFCMLDK